MPRSLKIDIIAICRTNEIKIDLFKKISIDSKFNRKESMEYVRKLFVNANISANENRIEDICEYCSDYPLYLFLCFTIIYARRSFGGVNYIESDEKAIASCLAHNIFCEKHKLYLTDHLEYILIVQVGGSYIVAFYLITFVIF